MATYTGVAVETTGEASTTTANRTGFDSDPVGLSGGAVLASEVDGPDPTQVVNGFQPDALAARASRPSRAWSARGAEVAGSASRSRRAWKGRGVGFGPDQDDPDGSGGPTGALIPLQYFRYLRGKVVDTDGNPLDDALYIYTREALPTGGAVDDSGRFSIPVLRRQYNSFLLVGASGRTVDYAWYRPVDTVVGSREQDVTLVFEPFELKGLKTGGPVSFGGMF